MGMFDSFKSFFKKDNAIFPVEDVPLESYNGPPPYIFVCYAHKDAELVYPELVNFNNIGINVFYDDGLPTGDPWFATIEAKIKSATLLVPFMSPNTVASKPSRKEIFLAFRSDIPILPIYLKETELKEGLDYAIGDEQSIFKYAMKEERYVRYYTREFKRYGFKIKTRGISGKHDDGLPTYHDKHSRRSHPLFSNRYSAPDSVSAKCSADEVILSGSGSVINQETILWPTRKSNKNYIYASYSNLDIDSVIPQIENFKDNGYGVKFYRGTEGDVTQTAQLIDNCSFLVVFISKNSIDSKSVQNEVSYALQKNKPVVPIYIEEVNLNSSLSHSLSESSEILKYRLSDGQFNDAYVRKFDEYYPRTTDRSGSVFISYSIKDREIADKVCNLLENGISCWIVPRNVMAGENYAEQTVNAIKNSQVVVLIFSRNANDSNYVYKEIEMAFSLDKPVVSFRVDDSLPTGGLEFFLKNKFWIDAYPDVESHFKELLELF